MLLKFSASNYLSFQEETAFSMIASRERQHGERIHVTTRQGARVLPVAAIFGANASGKSNFYRSIQFLRRLVLSAPQSADDRLVNEPFRLDDGAGAIKPSRFVIEILPVETAYRLSIAIGPDGIVEEKLEELRTGDRTNLIYSRYRESSAEEMKWDIDPLQRRAETAADREFIGFKTRDTLPNQLYLAGLRGKNVPIADEVNSWFSEQLALMLPNTTFKLLEFHLPSMVGLRDFCSHALQRADTGALEIGSENIAWDSFAAPPEIKDEIKRKLGENEITFMLSPDGRRYSIIRRGGQLHVARLFTMHMAQSGKPVRFELTSESQGTQRFLDLLPAFFELTNSDRPKVFVIDELDRSLHTALTSHLVSSYLGALRPGIRSQLIFTTHDTSLLKQGMFRRDELWIMNKKLDGASSMKSLVQIEGLRYDRELRRSFESGEFGGVPRLSEPLFSKDLKAPQS